MNNDPQALLEKYGPKEVKVLESDRQLARARFSPCGDFLLAGSYDGQVYRWDLSADETPALAPHKEHHAFVQGLEFDPKNPVVYSADSWGQLCCWSYREEAPATKWANPTAHDGWIHALSVSADGRWVASCGHDRMVRVWETASGKLHQELAGHAEPVFAVRFHPDGKSLVSGDLKGVVKHWDAATGKCVRDLDANVLYQLHRLQDCGGVRALAFDRQGKTLAIAGTKPENGGTVQGVPTVLLWDWAAAKQRSEVALGDKSECFVHELILHPDDFIMAVTSGTPGRGRLQFIKPGEEKAFYSSKKMQNCHSLAAHPDGFRLAVAATSRGSNGNGRRVDKDGNYVGNTSPIYILEMPGGQQVAEPAKTG